jgi:hypothetical protein
MSLIAPSKLSSTLDPRPHTAHVSPNTERYLRLDRLPLSDEITRSVLFNGVVQSDRSKSTLIFIVPHSASPSTYHNTRHFKWPRNAPRQLHVPPAMLVCNMQNLDRRLTNA